MTSKTDAPQSQSKRRERTRAALALGGNVGDVQRTFKRALARLERDPDITVLRRSDWFETDPVGGPVGQPKFWNGAVTLEVCCSPRELLERCQAIETHFGRDRGAEEADGPRPLDLDLLLFGEVRIDEPDLQVPHPRLTERRFVLEPLVQVAADWVVPAAGGDSANQSVQALWQVMLEGQTH